MSKIFESTPAYRKGLIGEEIVKKCLERLNVTVCRPNDTAPSGASVVDFFVKANGEYLYSYYVEVKVKSPVPYAYGRFLTYMFPKTQIELYKRYAKEKDSHIDIYIVDEQRENIYIGSINDCPGIEDPLRIEDKTFPLDVEQSNGQGMYRVYSVEQFYEGGKIDFNDLERLASIKFSDADKKIFKPLAISVPDISTDELLAESHAAVSKLLDVNLPDDLPRKGKKISEFVNALRLKLDKIPTSYFYEIYHAVHNINTANPIPAFVSKFYPLLDEIKHKRQKTSNQKLDVIELETPAKKIAELRTPNDTLLEIFEVADNELKFFVNLLPLAMAIGHGRRGCYSPWTALGEAVRVFTESYSDKNFHKYVPVKDVSAIVKEYAFNREDDIYKCNTAKKFFDWWSQAAESYLEPPPHEETPSAKNVSFTAEDVQAIGKIADSITEVFGATRQEALHAAIKIKARELNRDLTPLMELLKI